MIALKERALKPFVFTITAAYIAMTILLPSGDRVETMFSCGSALYCIALDHTGCHQYCPTILGTR